MFPVAAFKPRGLTHDQMKRRAGRLLQIDVVRLLIGFLIFVLLVHVLDYMLQN